MGAFFRNLLAKLPHNTQVMLWMVALPLAVAAFGWFELTQYRSLDDPQMREMTEEIAQIKELVAHLQANPRESVTINGQEQRGFVAINRLVPYQRALEAEYERLTTAGRIVRPAAIATIALGLLAALWGLGGLWGVRAAARRALQSRDDLVTAFTRWRAHLPRYLGVLLALIVAAFLAITVVRAAVTYDVFTGPDHVSRSGVKGQLLLLALAVLMAWGALTALWRLRRSLQVLDEPAAVLGRALTPQDAPGLWQYVRDIAHRVGIAPPQNVVLGMEDSFYVTAFDTVAMPAGQRLTGQTLHLPLTYLALLRKDEIDAIVAHEMGHFVGADTAYGQRFAPLYAGMVHALHNVADGDEFEWGNAPAVTFGGYVLEQFDRAVKHWSRVRELAADQVSAQQAGAEAAARALVHVTALADVVHERVGEIARRPDEAGHDLIDQLQQAVLTNPLAVPAFDAESATAHPHDTHPPTLERLQALGQPLSPALVQAALAPTDAGSLAWVRSLFADSEAVQQSLLADFTSTARARNEETRTLLTRMVETTQDHIAIDDRRTMLWLFGGVGVFLAGLGVLFLVSLTSTSMRGTSNLAMLASLWGGAALFLGFAWWAWLRQKRPAAILTPEGLQLPGVDRVVSWGDIDDWNVTSTNGNLFLAFTLEPEAPAPALATTNDRRLSWHAKKRRLGVGSFGVRGMKDQRFLELLLDYKRAWHAREALNRM